MLSTLITSHLTAAYRKVQTYKAFKQLGYLNAAMYSASPIGGLREPDQAMFTLNPVPSSIPTWRWKDAIYMQIPDKFRYKVKGIRVLLLL